MSTKKKRTARSKRRTTAKGNRNVLKDSPDNRPLKTCELVALDIVRDIVASRANLGDGLPDEAKMLTRYRTSRSSLREALRLLEVQGLVNIRAGRGTGTTVGMAHHDNLARTLTLFLHMTGATYSQLLEAWVRSEPLLAQLAAENKDRTRVKKLLSAYMQGDAAEPDGRRRPWTWREGLQFHRVVADLANNPVLSLILSAIADIHTNHLLSVVIKRDPSDHAFFVHDHIEIATAIIAGDGIAARDLMEAHARHTVEEYKASWPRQVGERIEWR